jgi:hypothetical protein
LDEVGEDGLAELVFLEFYVLGYQGEVLLAFLLVDC